MDLMSNTISENLKKIRKEKKLSLDAVSEVTGVSKSMLGQIERGESSPTVATLWKIATGLHISFTALMEMPEGGIRVIDKSNLQPLLSDEGRFSLYPMFPFDEERKFEMLYIEMEPGAISDSSPHQEGTEEMVMVFEGSIRITVGGEEYVAEQGSAIRYYANKPHCYQNVGDGIARMSMLIYYEQ